MFYLSTHVHLHLCVYTLLYLQRMEFRDWCKYFTDADVCHLINTSLLTIDKTWNEVMILGSWTKNAEPLRNRCGGCMNHKHTFLQNPQYLFEVTKEVDEVLISLQQRDMKIHRRIGQGENLTLGFAVFKVVHITTILD